MIDHRRIVNARISQLCVRDLSCEVVAQKVRTTLGRHQPVFLQHVTERQTGENQYMSRMLTDPKFRAEEIAEILGIDRESNGSRILI
jgi:hypothetical protein